MIEPLLRLKMDPREPGELARLDLTGGGGGKGRERERKRGKCRFEGRGDLREGGMVIKL